MLVLNLRNSLSLTDLCENFWNSNPPWDSKRLYVTEGDSGGHSGAGYDTSDEAKVRQIISVLALSERVSTR